MPDYLSQRQNVLTQDPAEKAELNTYLETLADHFGLRWLERGGENPVQTCGRPDMRLQPTRC